MQQRAVAEERLSRAIEEYDSFMADTLAKFGTNDPTELLNMADKLEGELLEAAERLREIVGD